MHKRTVRSLIGGALLFAAASSVAAAAVHGTPATAIIGRDANGGSGGGSFSQDSRRVTYYAFTSAASNLIAGDSNGHLDVYLLRRSASPGGLGGSLQRASVSNTGQQTDGDSSNPSVDGDTNHRSHCVAFQSTATDLAPQTVSPGSRVYVRNLLTRRTVLASGYPPGASDPVIDGACQLVSYEQAGTIFVRDLAARQTYKIARGTQPDQQTDGEGVAYSRGGQVWYQAYRRIHKHGHRARLARASAPRLVSAGARGRGNGISTQASVSDNGDYIAFASTSTNLCTDTCRGISRDRNGPVSDIFRRTMAHDAPTPDRMEMASFSTGVNAQGDGPSDDPAISGAGQFVAFDSAASNLRPSRAIRDIDPNGAARDIFIWNAPPSKRGAGNVSRESRPGVKGSFNAPSIDPTLSSHGNYLAFASTETGALSDDTGAFARILLRYLGGK
jgi:WD40-like Beta Propeller Repeat